MKRLISILIFLSLCISSFNQDFSGKLVALYQFPIEIEIQNDQGEMNTKDYLKEYGTKGKTRALESMYSIMIPFITERLLVEKINIMPCEEVALIKSNPYGIPNMLINKAVKNCEKADYFLKIAIKDITVTNPTLQQTDLPVKMRTITVRCRISLMDRGKNQIKSLEASFNSGEKIESEREKAIGIDIRRITGPEWEQELKIYESCCKMAFLKAMDNW